MLLRPVPEAVLGDGMDEFFGEVGAVGSKYDAGQVVLLCCLNVGLSRGGDADGFELFVGFVDEFLYFAGESFLVGAARSSNDVEAIDLVRGVGDECFCDFDFGAVRTGYDAEFVADDFDKDAVFFQVIEDACDFAAVKAVADDDAEFLGGCVAGCIGLA